MDAFFITQPDFLQVLTGLSEGADVFTLTKRDFLWHQKDRKDSQNFSFQKFDRSQEELPVYQAFRATENIKNMIFKAKDVAGLYFGKTVREKPKRPQVFVGLKNCDLRSLEVLDSVFQEGDFIDPQYVEYRKKNLIISADCSDYKPVCYCVYLGISPNPVKNFDLNISEVSDGILIEVGSQKGRGVIEKYKSLFREPAARQLEEREENRARMQKNLETNVERMGLPSVEGIKDLIRKKPEDEAWKDEAQACVECGACTQACPTCHCFLLYDQTVKNGYAKFKIWDSCQLQGFARVAGGASPRPRRWQRLRNRYVKKFDFFEKNLGLYACTGCGRCIEACPGEIDMREVFKKLSK
jgi:ferredoxin